MEFLILLTLFATLLSFSTQVISPMKIHVLCTQPTAVLTKTMSLFRNMTCVLTQRQCTTHAATMHQLSTPASAIQIYTAPSVLTRKDYRGWTLGMHVPAHAELELLSDIQLGRALVHHQYMLELPAGYFQHPNTADASQAVTVVAKATLKIKGLSICWPTS